MYGLGSAEETHKVISRIYKQGEGGLSHLKKIINTPDYNRRGRLFKTPEMLAQTQLSRSTFRRYALSGKITFNDCSPEELIRKKEFTLQEIYLIREQTGKGFWGGLPSPPKRSAITIAMAMFKGGVGKTTQAVHLAAAAAISGLKTLLIDCDYQGSGTLALGYVPGLDISIEKNISDALLVDPNKISESVVRTHIYNCFLIPASLALSGANVELLNPNINRSTTLGNPLDRLNRAIATIKDDYDLIILDCPPNFEAVSMNAIVASDGIIMPVTPNMLSFASAVSFCETVSQLLESLIDAGVSHLIDNKLFRVLITNDSQNAETEMVVSVMKQVFGEYLMKNHMPKTIALDRASNELSILYDLTRSEVRGDKKAFDRAITSMDMVNNEIFMALKSIWGIEE